MYKLIVTLMFFSVSLLARQEVFSIDRNFGVGTGKRVELKCNKGLISELWLHPGSGSDEPGILLKLGKETRSRCQGGHVDKVGF